MKLSEKDAKKQKKKHLEKERNKKIANVSLKKQYQPGHKNMTGPAKHNALINLLGTSDLDEVVEGCAPHLTDTIYGIRDKLNSEEESYKAKYFELKGRYDELQKNYQELLAKLDDK